MRKWIAGILGLALAGVGLALTATAATTIYEISTQKKAVVHVVDMTGDALATETLMLPPLSGHNKEIHVVRLTARGGALENHLNIHSQPGDLIDMYESTFLPVQIGEEQMLQFIADEPRGTWWTIGAGAVSTNI